MSVACWSANEPSQSLFTTQGYTFLPAANTSTPLMPLSPRHPCHFNPPDPKPSRTLARFRSLCLRPRSKSTTSPPEPPKSKPKPKYVPPPLSNDLALLQFLEGGSTDKNLKRLMDSQAHAAAPKYSSDTVRATVGVATAHRDENGGLWWDQEEQWEYTRLLQAKDAERVSWVHFGDTGTAFSERFRDAPRRGSTVSTQADDDDDLDLCYAVQPPSPNTLALPTHRIRTAKHLRKPEHLTDFDQAIKSGLTRRRPPPLNLHDPRRDFIDDSFAPAPRPPRTTSRSVSTKKSTKKC